MTRLRPAPIAAIAAPGNCAQEITAAAAPSAKRVIATKFCGSASGRKCSEHNSTHTKRTRASGSAQARPAAARSPVTPPKQPMNPTCMWRTESRMPIDAAIAKPTPGERNPVQVTMIRSVMSCALMPAFTNACRAARSASDGACRWKACMRSAVLMCKTSASGSTAARCSMPLPATTRPKNCCAVDESPRRSACSAAMSVCARTNAGVATPGACSNGRGTLTRPPPFHWRVAQPTAPS